MGKFITKFNTMAEYNAYTADTVHFFTPNVSITSENPTEPLYKPFDPYNGHDYVEIGGLKWATMNVGASGITDTGLYFQWGDTQGYTADQVGENEGQKHFGLSDYKYGNGASTLTDFELIKYNSTDGKIILDIEDDGARVNWGGLWRMPTKEEFQHFYDSVEHELVRYQGSDVLGYLCTDKTDSSKVLFFPLCGDAYYGQVDLKNVEGHYWTSSLNSDQIRNAYELFTDDEDSFGLVSNFRTYGYPIRPVIG